MTSFLPIKRKEKNIGKITTFKKNDKKKFNNQFIDCNINN